PPSLFGRSIMRRTTLAALGVAALAAGWLGSPPPAAGQVPDAPPPFVIQGEGGPRRGGDARHPDFNTVVRGAKEHDGLFKLYQKDDHVYMEIRPEQFNRPVLCPIAVAR